MRAILGLAAGGWLLFLSVAVLAGASPGLAIYQGFSRNYVEVFFSLLALLALLALVLIGDVVLHVARSEIGLRWALLLVIGFLLLNFLGLKLVRPFFFTAFPGVSRAPAVIRYTTSGYTSDQK